MRPSGRAPDALRAVSFTPGFSRHAEGSCLIRMGQTEVLCAASVEGRVPGFLRGAGLGWVTAEYGMLPRATHTRGDRKAASVSSRGGRRKSRGLSDGPCVPWWIVRLRTMQTAIISPGTFPGAMIGAGGFMGAVQLRDELQRDIERQVTEGRATTAAAFVEEAVLRLIDAAELEEQEVLAAAQAGIGDIAARRFTAINTPENGQRLYERIMPRLRASLAAEE
jgi:Arc/MetJ-type ribon-helix-helix transcriptional regulator